MSNPYFDGFHGNSRFKYAGDPLARMRYDAGVAHREELESQTNKPEPKPYVDVTEPKESSAIGQAGPIIAIGLIGVILFLIIGIGKDARQGQIAQSNGGDVVYSVETSDPTDPSRRANLRICASKDCDIVRALSQGTRVFAVETAVNGWSRVKTWTNDHQLLVGYINAKLIRVEN